MTSRQNFFISGIFLFLCAILDLWGGTNPRSRLALLSSIKEDHQFSIAAYKEWTIDWARTPDGRYFSNKAPGAVFLAAPVFWVIDSFLTSSLSERSERDRIRNLYAESISHWLSLLLQAVPFVLVFLWALRVMQGLSRASTAFFSIAFFFGTTATLFMNTYFGHGLAAVFATALLLGLVERRWFISGTLFGWGLLCDYGSALLLPSAIAVLWIESQGGRRDSLIKFLCGGILPAILWIGYHVACFGGAFTLPNRFQNPDFVEVSNAAALWGIFQSYPKPGTLFQLLFGPTRGILFTQPWMLMVLAAAPVLLKRSDLGRSARNIVIYSLSSFVMLLVMNASFINWHAGGSPGPRYLCAIFPSLAMLGAFAFEKIERMRPYLWAGLGVALAFASLVFGSHRLENPETIAVWKFFFSAIFLENARMPFIRWLIYWMIVGVGFWVCCRKKESPFGPAPV